MDSITQPSRRQFLAAGGATALAGLAGCTDIMNAVAGAILEDVNVLNGTEQERSGTVTVVDPNGETQLAESFTVAPSDSDDEEGDGPSSTPAYGNVFTDSGEYTVSVELDSAINETHSREATVAVDDTDEQHIIVGLGADDAPNPIEVLVIEDFSDLADRFGDDT